MVNPYTNFGAKRVLPSICSYKKNFFSTEYNNSKHIEFTVGLYLYTVKSTYR